MKNPNITILNVTAKPNGFAAIEAAIPLQLVVGMAAWTYDIMYVGIPEYAWTAEEIVTWAMMDYIRDP